MNARLARIRPDRFTLFLIAIALLAMGLVLARQITYGPALHWDSADYLGAARGLLDGDGLIHYWNKDVAHQSSLYEFWPPFFPMLLAASSLGVFDPQDVAGPLNAVCFGLTVLVAGHWLHQHLRLRFLRIWGCLALALALPLAWIASWAMSEAPFILFTTLALTRTSAFLREPRRSTLLWAAVFTALAWLTRYMGIAVVITVALMLLAQRDTPLTGKVRRTIGYGLIASLPLVLYLVRNTIALGSVTTNSQSVDYSLLDILARTAFYLGGWIGIFMQESVVAETARVILGIILVLSVCIGIVWLHRSEEEKNEWYPIYPLAIFPLLFYLLHVLAMFGGNTYHGVSERHLLPMYIPLLLVVLVLSDEFYCRFQKKFNSRFNSRSISPHAYVAMLLLSGWTCYNIYLSVTEIMHVNFQGNQESYQEGTYAESEVLDFINEIRDREVYGNFPDVVVYFHTGQTSGYFGIPNSYDQLMNQIDHARDGSHLLYSSEVEFFADYNINDVQEMTEMEIVEVFSDGIVFRIFEPQGMPILRSRFNIFRSGSTLIYHKESCEEDDFLPMFFLDITPMSADDLPASKRQQGIERWHFDFRSGLNYVPGHCIRSISLPDYPVARIRTGQFNGDEIIWDAETNIPPDDQIYDVVVAGDPEAIVSFHGNTLLYVRESCDAFERVLRFFLHVFPAEQDDLPESRKQYGFDNLNFNFREGPGYDPLLCIRRVPLPDFAIASIRTGQFYGTGEGYRETWSKKFSFAE